MRCWRDGKLILLDGCRRNFTLPPVLRWKVSYGNRTKAGLGKTCPTERKDGAPAGPRNEKCGRMAAREIFRFNQSHQHLRAFNMDGVAHHMAFDGYMMPNVIFEGIGVVNGQDLFIL